MLQTIVASGSDLKYQWQYKENTSSNWRNFQNATGSSLTKKVTSEWNGWKVRCVITDSNGTTLTSDEVQISVIETM